MKRFIVLFVILLFVFPVIGNAEVYEKKEPIESIVIANQISVRVEPDARSQRIAYVKNSSELFVVGQDGKWYIIDLQRSGIDGGDYEYGYVQARYVVTDGYNIVVNGSLQLYADPWSGMCNGERTSGATLFVIYETENWLVVQTNDEKAGSSFVRKSDAGLYSWEEPTYYDELTKVQVKVDPSTRGYVSPTYDYPECNTYWSVMHDKDGVSVALREYPDLSTEKLVIIHSGDIVRLISDNGEFAFVTYQKTNGQYVYGWVKTRYFVPVNNG